MNISIVCQNCLFYSLLAEYNRSCNTERKIHYYLKAGIPQDLLYMLRKIALHVESNTFLS
jgi:hypothetical protein